MGARSTRVLEMKKKVIVSLLLAFVMLFSFNFIAMGGIGVLIFFLTLVLGPIGVRLAYEMTMMFIMIWRNTRDIAENTGHKKKD